MLLDNERRYKDWLSRFWCMQDGESSVHLFRYPAGVLDCPEHSHAEFSIIICLESRLSYRVAGDWESIEPGKTLIIQSGEWHRGVYNVCPVPMGVTISVTQRGLKRLMAKMGTHIDPDRMEINLPRVAEDSRLFYLAQEMAGEIRGRAPGRDVVMTSLVTQFLIYLLRFCVVPAAPKRRHQLAHQLPAWEMVRAVECMNHWGKSTFSLARLCAEIGSCQSRFTQLFRNSTNINPLNFYNMLLINKAKSLLACSGMSIKEIAYTLEFQNESHFCTLFRAIAGTTPSRFRIFGDTPTEQVLGNCPVVR